MKSHQKPAWEVKAENDAKAIAERLNASYDECFAFVYEGGDEYNVPLIKKYLRTPEQKAYLDAHDWSLEDVLNGRIEGGSTPEMVAMFESWNEKLGQRWFGTGSGY